VEPRFLAAALIHFADAGQMVARMAEANYWGYEDMHRAVVYKDMLPGLRVAYGHLRTANDSKQAEAAIQSAMKIVRTGIEHNALRLAMACIQGDEAAISRAHPNF